MNPQGPYNKYLAAVDMRHGWAGVEGSPDQERVRNRAGTPDIPYSFPVTHPQGGHSATQGMGPMPISASPEYLAFEPGQGFVVKGGTPQFSNNGQRLSIPTDYPFRSSSPWSTEKLRMLPEHNTAVNTFLIGGYADTHSNSAPSNNYWAMAPNRTQSSPNSSVNAFMETSTETIQGGPRPNMEVGESPYSHLPSKMMTGRPHFRTGSSSDGKHSLQVPQNYNDPSTGGSSPASSVRDPMSPASGDTPSVLSCPTCGGVFTGEYRKGNLARHIRTQHGGGNNNPRTFKCESAGCSKSFRRKDARLKHMRKHHPEMRVADAITRGPSYA